MSTNFVIVSADGYPVFKSLTHASRPAAERFAALNAQQNPCLYPAPWRVVPAPDAQAVPCAECGSEVGDDCRGLDSGRRLAAPHACRVADAVNAAEPA